MRQPSVGSGIEAFRASALLCEQELAKRKATKKRTTVADYDRICAGIKRWNRRLSRAINALHKLEKQKARIERKLGLLEASS